MKMTITKGTPMREVVDKNSEYSVDNYTILSTKLSMKQLGQLEDEGMLQSNDSVHYAVNKDNDKIRYAVNNDKLLDNLSIIVSLKEVKKFTDENNIPNMNGSVFCVFSGDNKDDTNKILALLISQ